MVSRQLVTKEEKDKFFFPLFKGPEALQVSDVDTNRTPPCNVARIGISLAGAGKNKHR